MNMTRVNMTDGSDTHIDPVEAKQTHQEVTDNEKIDLEKLQKEAPEMIDDLYQSESYLELINAKYVLDEIKELQ